MKFSHTTGYAVFTGIKQWKKTILMIIMDVLLWAILFASASIFDYFFVNNESIFVGTWMGYGFLLVYFLIVAGAYSFFKYAVLQLLNSQQCEIKVTKNILFFYLYNLVMLAIVGILFIALATFFAVSLITVLKQVAVVVFVVLYALASYFFVSASHIFFITEKLSLNKIPDKVREAFSWKLLGRWVGWNIAFFIIFFVVYVLLYMIMQTMTENYLLFFIMNVLMFCVLVLEIYFLIFWNRMYMFLSIKDMCLAPSKSAQSCDKNVPQPLKKK